MAAMMPVQTRLGHGCGALNGRSAATLRRSPAPIMPRCAAISHQPAVPVAAPQPARLPSVRHCKANSSRAARIVPGAASIGTRVGAGPYGGEPTHPAAMLWRLIFKVAQLAVLLLYADIVGLTTHAVEAGVKALAPFSPKAAWLAQMVWMDPQVHMRFSSLFGNAPAWVAAGIALLCLEAFESRQKYNKNNTLRILISGGVGLFASCTLSVFSKAVRPLACAECWSWITSCWGATLAGLAVLAYFVIGPWGLHYELHDERKPLMQAVATVSHAASILCLPCLAAAYIYTQAAGSRVDQVFGWALMCLIMQPIAYGMFVASARPMDDRVRNRPDAWLPIPLQRAVAFAIAAAVCNAAVHTFSWAPAAALPARAAGFLKAALSGAL